MRENFADEVKKYFGEPGQEAGKVAGLNDDEFGAANDFLRDLSADEKAELKSLNYSFKNLSNIVSKALQDRLKKGRALAQPTPQAPGTQPVTTTAGPPPAAPPPPSPEPPKTPTPSAVPAPSAVPVPAQLLPRKPGALELVQGRVPLARPTPQQLEEQLEKRRERAEKQQAAGARPAAPPRPAAPGSPEALRQELLEAMEKRRAQIEPKAKTQQEGNAGDDDKDWD